MPGLTLTTITLPLPPISSSSVSPAVVPPPTLSDAICETAIDGSSSVVSTSTIFEFAAAALIGANSALVSVGAIRIASGLLAATASTIGVCWAASNWSGPWNSSVTPSSFAFSCAPQFIVM